MLSKSSKWELGFVHYITKFTLTRFIISRFECIPRNCHQASAQFFTSLPLKKALYKFKSQDPRYRIMKSKSIKSCFTLSTYYSGITYKISLRIAMEAVRKAMKRRRCGFDCIQIHLQAVDVITPNQKQFVLKKQCHFIYF